MIRGFLVVLVLVALGSTARAEANMDANGWVGGLFGLHVPDAEDVSARAAFGITAGAKLGSEWGLGGYYMSSSKEEDLAGVATDFEYSLLGIEFTYNFEGEAAGAYFGGRIGLTSLDVGNFDYNPYHWGALIGYNHFIGDRVSIGGEGTFFSIPKDSDSVAGVSVDSEDFHIISFLASAKFWF